LNTYKRHRSGRRKKNVLSRIVDSAKALLKNIFSSESKGPKEYRPYLGPNVKVSHREPEGNREAVRPTSNRIKRGSFISRLRGNWKSRANRRRKKRLKKQSLRKQKRAFQRKARQEWIRKIFPNYKKPRETVFTGIKEEVSANVQKDPHKNFYFYTINSTALYIIAYLLIYMIYQITVLIVASRWKLDSVLYYFDLAFNDYSPLWSRFNIIVITFSGPLVALLIGILFFRVFANRPKVKGFLKLFFLWIGMHGLNLFLGAFSTGVSFDEGFGYVANWLYLNLFWQILFSLIFLFLFGIIGFYAAPRFLETSNSVFKIKQENRTKFLFHQVFLPWLIGSLIIFMVKIPNNMPYDTGNLITMIVVAVPILFNRHSRPNLIFNAERKPTRISWIYIAIASVLILAFRIGLNNGLHVVLNYKFIFSLDISPL
jgi:hypothetical protein